LQFSGFIVFQVEVSSWIPILACLGIVVGYTTVGIVEWAFKSLAWTVFLIVLKDYVCHDQLLVAMYVL
jgi:hypothetical protein